MALQIPGSIADVNGLRKSTPRQIVQGIVNLPGDMRSRGSKAMPSIVLEKIFLKVFTFFGTTGILISWAKATLQTPPNLHITRTQKMTNATLSATLTVADILFNGIDSTARFTVKATRFTIKAARAAWPVIETVGILVLAIALYLGFKTYETGVAFRQWCDRLVEDSLEPQRLLMPAVDTLDTETDDAPNTDAILAEWRDRIGNRMIAESAAALGMTVEEYSFQSLDLTQILDADGLCQKLQDESPHLAQAIDTLKMVEEYRQVEAWTDLSGYNIRELKKMASAAKIKGYNKMTKAQLIRELAFDM